MTRTTWSTTQDVPPAPWAALVSDMTRLLTMTAASGAHVTGPGEDGGPVLDTETIAFTVHAPPGQPLTVTFHRAAGDGEVITNAPHTDGIVLVAMERAARAWGALLIWESDAGTAARAVAQTLLSRLYAPDDAAVSGGTLPTTTDQLAAAVSRAWNRVTYGDRGAPDTTGRAWSRAAYGDRPTSEAPLADQLGALIQELTAERAGVMAAAQLAGATPSPAPAPPKENAP